MNFYIAPKSIKVLDLTAGNEIIISGEIETVTGIARTGFYVDILVENGYYRVDPNTIVQVRN